MEVSGWRRAVDGGGEKAPLAECALFLTAPPLLAHALTDDEDGGVGAVIGAPAAECAREDGPILLGAEIHRRRPLRPLAPRRLATAATPATARAHGRVDGRRSIASMRRRRDATCAAGLAAPFLCREELSCQWMTAMRFLLSWDAVCTAAVMVLVRRSSSMLAFHQRAALTH